MNMRRSLPIVISFLLVSAALWYVIKTSSFKVRSSSPPPQQQLSIETGASSEKPNETASRTRTKTFPESGTVITFTGGIYNNNNAYADDDIFRQTAQSSSSSSWLRRTAVTTFSTDTTTILEKRVVQDRVVCRLMILDHFTAIPENALGNETTVRQNILTRARDLPGEDGVGCVLLSSASSAVMPDDNDLVEVFGMSSTWLRQHYRDLSRGTLYAEISHVRFVDLGTLHLTEASEVSVLEHYFQEHWTTGGGTVSDHTFDQASDFVVTQRRGNNAVILGIVLVSTSDADPTFSGDDVEEVLFSPDRVNLRTQFEACSFGRTKFRLSPRGVVSIRVNEPSSNFDSGMALVGAAAAELHRRTYFRMADLGDKVLVCLPPNIGKRAWVASAGVGHWRAQFNNEWCLSLSATMHELGHLLGLTHANENGQKYGDAVGYMAGGYKSQTAPRRCFNGLKSWDLGWYERRHYKMDATWLEPPKDDDDDKTPPSAVLDLAPMTDFDKAADDEYVIVNIADKFYITFNRAKGLNMGTGEKRNQVVINRPGEGGSDNMGGLSIGDRMALTDFVVAASDVDEDDLGVRINLYLTVCRFSRGRRNIADTVEISLHWGKWHDTCRFRRFNPRHRKRQHRQAREHRQRRQQQQQQLREERNERTFREE